jgi:hypothetical protein
MLSVIDSVLDIIMADDEEEVGGDEAMRMDSILDLHAESNELFLDSVLGVEESEEAEDGSSCGNGSSGEASQ